jgi:alkylhydroperoxidase/carboxymuconolactone decarboxylase family protein YurZ
VPADIGNAAAAVDAALAVPATTALIGIALLANDACALTRRHTTHTPHESNSHSLPLHQLRPSSQPLAESTHARTHKSTPPTLYSHTRTLTTAAAVGFTGCAGGMGKSAPSVAGAAAAATAAIDELVLAVLVVAAVPAAAAALSAAGVLLAAAAGVGGVLPLAAAFSLAAPAAAAAGVDVVVDDAVVAATASVLTACHRVKRVPNVRANTAHSYSQLRAQRQAQRRP